LASGLLGLSELDGFGWPGGWFGGVSWPGVGGEVGPEEGWPGSSGCLAWPRLIEPSGAGLGRVGVGRAGRAEPRVGRRAGRGRLVGELSG
jgi:hypothetical protein